MRDNLKKLIKRWLKRKVTITIGMMVAFMITGGIVYSNDETIDKTVIIKEKDEIIVVQTSNGIEIGDIKIENNIFTWTNNDTICVKEEGKEETSIVVEEKGNGLIIDNSISKDKNLKIRNNRVISGFLNLKVEKATENAYTNASGSGNGINSYNFNDDFKESKNSNIGDIENFGIINGYISLDSGIVTTINAHKYAHASTNGSGNGISSYTNSFMSNGNSNIGDIENFGIINGYISLTGGTVDTKANAISDADANAYTNADQSGNGISSYNSSMENGDSNIGDIKNFGVISGYISLTGGIATATDAYAYISASASANADQSGNGISSYNNSFMSNKNNNIGDIENFGVISGYISLTGGTATAIYTKSDVRANVRADVNANGSGNGISSYNDSMENNDIGDIENFGVISGYTELVTGTVNIKIDGGSDTYSNASASTYGSGNGISNIGNKIDYIINSGIISGSSNVSGEFSGNGISNRGVIATIINHGIIAGSNKALEGIDIGNNNYGLLIDGAGTNNIIINAGVGGEIQETGDYLGYTVMNTFNSGTTNIDSETQVVLSGNNNKLIINGYNKGLYVDNSITLSNSIINSYTSAINIDGGNLTGYNIIVNGGVDKKYDSSNILISQSPAIAGSTNVDTLTLKGNSIINGNIDLGDGADNLIIANTVQINGELLGGNGGDTLTFNSGDTSTFALNESNINIFNNVDGFETINIATNVTFFETSQVTGANNISIKKDGNLILRIDSTNNNSNAFSNNTGTISSEGGKLLLALNGIGEGETINLGNTILDDTIKGNEIGYSSDITLDTTSLLYTLARGEGNTIKVNTVENLPVLPPIDETPEEDDITPPIEDNNTSNIDEYNNLNSIYQSIRDNNLVKEFDVTDDNKLAGFYSYLHDIYAGNPVAFSSTLSKKSSSMFSDIVMNKDLTTDINKWSIYGGFTHIDGGTKDSYYGKKDYTYNIVNKDIDVDSKISGMYALGEYGLSNNSTFGIIFGGNQAQSKLNNGSKVDGDSFYLGTYTKKYLGNLKLVAGLGYQYGDYKSDRVAIGYENIIDTKTYHSNYNDNTLSICGQAKYSNKLAKNLYLEPSVGIEYTYIDQNESSESGILGIETESKEFNYTTAKFGVDLRKDIPTSSATHSLVTGVYYNRMLDGYDVQNIKGSFKEGSNFDILVSPSNKHELGLRAKYELSLNNGVTFDLKGSYTFAREKYNNDNKNEYKGEWLIGTGIGYKF